MSNCRGLVVSATFLAGCQAPAPKPFTPFPDGYAVLMEPMEYRVGNTEHIITVPRGFVTDFASTPRAIWAVIPPFGRYQLAAVVHDYLYWEQGCTREQADKLFLKAMEESNVAPATRSVIFRSVRVGGGSAWNGNADEKEVGKPRVIPEGFLDIPANKDWRVYRMELAAKGVKPGTKPQQAPAYCAAVE